MIVSHAHQFIFIKTTKTAGTSVEMSLARHCGPDDIITPLQEVDERAKADAGVRGAQNCWAPLREYGASDFGKLFLQRKRKLAFVPHAAARDIRARLGADVWDSYFKFSIERNPFDRIISAYFWQTGRLAREVSLSEYIESKGGHPKARGFDLYTIQGQVAVDRVIRFEHLDSELGEVFDLLGLPGPPNLPHAKSRHRPDRRHYRELLSDHDRATVERIYADELQLFGYAF